MSDDLRSKIAAVAVRHPCIDADWCWCGWRSVSDDYLWQHHIADAISKSMESRND